MPTDESINKIIAPADMDILRGISIPQPPVNPTSKPVESSNTGTGSSQQISGHGQGSSTAEGGER